MAIPENWQDQDKPCKGKGLLMQEDGCMQGAAGCPDPWRRGPAGCKGGQDVHQTRAHVLLMRPQSNSLLQSWTILLHAWAVH